MGVGSDRSRSHRRHVPAAAPGLPEAAEICSPSQRNRVDEHSGRITSVGLAAHCGLGAVAFPHTNPDRLSIVSDRVAGNRFATAQTITMEMTMTTETESTQTDCIRAFNVTFARRSRQH